MLAAYMRAMKAPRQASRHRAKFASITHAPRQSPVVAVKAIKLLNHCAHDRFSA